jgi:von Willebrand factor type A domain
MLRRHTKLIAWIVSVGFHVALAVLFFQNGFGEISAVSHKPNGLTRDNASGEESSFTMSVERTADARSTTPITITPPTGQRPVEPVRTEPISKDLQNLVRELGNRPPPRIEVQDVSPVEFREPTEVPSATSSTTEPMPAAVATPSFGTGQPLHGALPAGKSVVYILDRSTSMGLTRETFDGARAALLASVQALPDDGRFQVIAYNGQAVRLLPGRELLKKVPESEGQLIAALQLLKPEGDSHHDVALRAALALGGDYLVFITDADDDELKLLRPILKGHVKTVSVSIVRVQAGKVSPPSAFK